MGTFGQRVTERMNKLKLTGVQVKNHCRVSSTTVTNWQNGDHEATGRNLELLAQILECSPAWLLHGREKERPSSVTRLRGDVPLISKITAGKWAAAEDPYLPGDAEKFINCPAPHGPNTYALRVDGDSMTAQYGKSYPNGCIIYVDPDQTGKISSGDRVVAVLEGNDDVVFKQYIKEGSNQFLRPLNPQFPAIHDPFRLIGRVIGKFEEE